MMTRSCGDCTLCCKLLPIKEGARSMDEVTHTCAAMVTAGLATVESFRNMILDFNKPAGEPCPHQRHGKGCVVYARRPFGCRYWNCRWLVNDDTADLRRPDRARYVIDIMPDFITLFEGETRVNIEVVQVWVDPKHPEAWRDPALLDYLERRGREGKAALLRFNSRDAITVFPPAMCSDGGWHTKAGSGGAEHTLADRVAGIGTSRHIKLAVSS